MKKHYLLVSLVAVSLLIVGCGSKEAAPSPQTKVTESQAVTISSSDMSQSESQLTVMTTEDSSQESEGSATVATTVTTTTTTSPTSPKTEANEVAQPEAASPQSASFSVAMGDSNNRGGMSYSVAVTNTSSVAQRVDGSLFNLNKSSQAVDVNENLASQSSAVKEVKPGETVTFENVLGPVSGDTPGYYQLTASYNGSTIWSQEPQLK